jgi:hypothetical protein
MPSSHYASIREASAEQSGAALFHVFCRICGQPAALLHPRQPQCCLHSAVDQDVCGGANFDVAAVLAANRIYRGITPHKGALLCVDVPFLLTRP